MFTARSLDRRRAPPTMRDMGARRTRAPIDALRVRPAAEAVAPDPWAGEDERWAAEDRERERLARLEAEVEEEDLLAPARAVIVGILLVIPLWLLLGGAAYAIYRALS